MRRRICLVAVLMLALTAGSTFSKEVLAQPTPLVEAELEGPVYVPTQDFPCGGSYVIARRLSGKVFAEGDNLEALVRNSSNGVLRYAFSSATPNQQVLKVYVSVCSFDSRYAGADETYTIRITFLTGDGKAGQELLLNFNLTPRPAVDQVRASVQSACGQASVFSVKVDAASLKQAKNGRITIRGTIYRGGVESPNDSLTLWSGTSLSGRKVADAKTDADGRFAISLKVTKTDLYFTVDVPNRTVAIDGYLPVRGFPGGAFTLFPDSRSGGKNLKFDPIYGGGFPLPVVSTECRQSMNQYRSIASNPPAQETFTSPKAEPAGTFKLVAPDGGVISAKRCWVRPHTREGKKVNGYWRRCP